MEPIWSGVYSRFLDVPVVGEGFSGERWRTSCRKRMDTLLGQVQGQDRHLQAPIRSFNMLSLLAATVMAERGRARILDFGGGLGEDFLMISEHLGADAAVDYTVLEVKEVCEFGQKLHDDPRLKFIDTLPEGQGLFDIVHFGSSIHYLEYWQEIVKKAVALSSGYIFFVDLPAGDNPAYISSQRYYESVIPVWFFNQEQFIEQLVEYECDLIWQAIHNGAILGEVQPLPQDNFPETHRVGYCLDMLFRRRES